MNKPKEAPPRFYIYNQRSREFLRYTVSNADGRFEGPRDRPRVAWTPCHLYGKAYMLAGAARTMAQKLNQWHGDDFCEVVSEDRAIRIERANDDYWRTQGARRGGAGL